MYFNHLGCCGIRELCDLSRCMSAVMAFKEYDTLLRNNSAHYRYAVFSQANVPDTIPRKVYGERFAAYILKHNLGTVIETEENINPNSGNLLKVWIWTVDHVAVTAHARALEDKTTKPKRR